MIIHLVFQPGWEEGISLLLLSKHGQQEACSHPRSYNTRNIGPHGMHEQVVGWIGFLPFYLGYPGSQP